MPEHNPYPKTIAGAIKVLYDSLDAEDKRQLKLMKKSELWQLHHGYGTGVRNRLGLWGKNFWLCLEIFIKTRYWHPDDMSLHLIEKLWLHLQSDNSVDIDTGEENP